MKRGKTKLITLCLLAGIVLPIIAALAWLLKAESRWMKYKAQQEAAGQDFSLEVMRFAPADADPAVNLARHPLLEDPNKLSAGTTSLNDVKALTNDIKEHTRFTKLSREDNQLAALSSAGKSPAEQHAAAKLVLDELDALAEPFSSLASQLENPASYWQLEPTHMFGGGIDHDLSPIYLLKFLNMRVSCHLIMENSDAAMADIQLIWRLAGKLAANPKGMTAVTATAMIRSVSNYIWHGMETNQFSRDQLLTLLQMMQNEPVDQANLRDIIVTNRAQFIADMNAFCGYAHGTPTLPRQLPRKIIASLQKSNYCRQLDASGLLEKSPNVTTSQLELLKYWTERPEPNSFKLNTYALGDCYLSTLRGSAQSIAMQQASIELSKLALANALFKIDHNRQPASLAELRSAYQLAEAEFSFEGMAVKMTKDAKGENKFSCSIPAELRVKSSVTTVEW
ncbi:hypothetical protein [Persicirhabdus sediminis]|uniref:Uncharacterized protein n=1 Tax=Persicirhabdus sediminis TaxID=454144 RepID=A0A8J7MF10_9BACT|nr:hypothetical protein [Persicirhabdus sediminis]MBK1791476.1 hypothetical protein [Persicirhabdus sediminis]